jgi:hypothetical protein
LIKKSDEVYVLVEIMKSIYNAPKAICGLPLLKNTHRRGGMFVGRYVDDNEGRVTGVNAPTSVEIVLVEANLKRSLVCSATGCSIDGFGFIVRPSIGKIFHPDAEANVVNFYRYLPLICARVSIKSIASSTIVADSGEDARVTLFGNVLHVEHFIGQERMKAVEQSLRTGRICVLQINTHSFLVSSKDDKEGSQYFYSDVVGDDAHEITNGNASYFFDQEIGQLGHDLQEAEYFAFKFNETNNVVRRAFRPEGSLDCPVCF